MFSGIRERVHWERKQMHSGNKFEKYWFSAAIEKACKRQIIMHIEHHKMAIIRHCTDAFQRLSFGGIFLGGLILRGPYTHGNE